MAEPTGFFSSPDVQKAVASLLTTLSVIGGLVGAKWRKRISDRRETDTKSLRFSAFFHKRCCEKHAEFDLEIARVLSIIEGLKEEGVSYDKQLNYLFKMFPGNRPPDFAGQIKAEIAAAQKTHDEIHAHDEEADNAE